MINTLLDKARRQASGGGGAAPFEMGNSLYTDGVNDVAEIGTATATAFNPFQTSAWSCSFWAKPTTTATMYLFGVKGPSYNRFWMRLDGNGRMTIGSHGRIVSTTVSIPSGGAHWTSWNMYSISVEVTSASTQTVYFYFNGALFQTVTSSKYSYTNTTAELALGGTARSGADFQGYSTQYVFTENLVPVSEWLALYNSGSGADPSVVITSPHSIYNITESAGTTSGDIVDALGEQDLTMSGFVAPFGVNAEAP